MAADAPAVGPAFLLEVVVAEQLGVHVVDFEAGVVGVGAFDGDGGRLDEEALLRVISIWCLAPGVLRKQWR